METTKTIYIGWVKLYNRLKNKIYVHLSYTDDKKFCFAASIEVWNSQGPDIIIGGQAFESIKEEIESKESDIDEKLFSEIYTLWEKYHLNDFHAGTPKQEKLVAEYNSINNNILARDYNFVCYYLKKHNLLYDKDIEGLSCSGGFPEDVKNGKRGYKYGERWIYKEIPEKDKKKIMKLVMDK